MQYLMCSNYASEGCTWAFAYLYDNSTVDIVRKKQRFNITGSTFNILGTCTRCTGTTAVIVKDGKIIDDGITVLSKEQYDEQVKRAKEKREAPGTDGTIPETEPVSDNTNTPAGPELVGNDSPGGPDAKVDAGTAGSPEPQGPGEPSRKFFQPAA